MQHFVSCPFCGQVFDALETPGASFTLDGVRRTAHLSCIPIRGHSEEIKADRLNTNRGTDVPISKIQPNGEDNETR